MLQPHSGQWRQVGDVAAQEVEVRQRQRPERRKIAQYSVSRIRVGLAKQFLQSGQR
jgi:hypothetical protein